MKHIDVEERNELVLSASVRLLRHSREKIFIKNKGLIYLAASDRFAEMAGWESGEKLVGMTDYEIFKDQDLAERYRADDEEMIRRDKDLIDYVEPITEKDGKPRYASTSKFILRDENNRFMGLVGVSRDITMEYYLQRNRVRELEYLFSLPVDVYFAAYLDIDDWRIISEQHQTVGGFDFSFHKSIQRLAVNAYKGIPDPKSSAHEFYQNFTHDELRTLYNNGKTKLVVEYQRLANAELRWVRDEISFLQDTVSGHLCMMLVVRDIRQKKADEENRIRLAERDEMTGLLNRQATMQLIRERLENSCDTEQHALVMIDADHFKDVNDTYGHQAGDKALTEFAHAIAENFGSSDLVGRIGGDEFFVLMPHVPDRETVEIKTASLLESLRKVHYKDVWMSGSIGVSLYPSDARTLQEMYALSDKAVYAVKAAGKNGVIFAADMREQRER